MSVLTQNDIYFNTMIKKNISLRPKFLNKNLEENIKNIIVNSVEGKCVKEGYIVKNSVEILKRSIGNMNSNQFTGNVNFEVIFGAKVCNVPVGSVLKAKIRKINKLGLLAEIGPLMIIVPREIHNSKELFKSLQIGEEIDIYVIGKTFKLNNQQISVYGKLNEEANKKITIPKRKIKIKSSNVPDQDNFDSEFMPKSTKQETIQSEEGKDFMEESLGDEIDDMETNVVEDMSDFEDELEEEGAPENELDEEIIDDELSPEGSFDLDEEITF